MTDKAEEYPEVKFIAYGSETNFPSHAYIHTQSDNVVCIHVDMRQRGFYWCSNASFPDEPDRIGIGFDSTSSEVLELAFPDYSDWKIFCANKSGKYILAVVLVKPKKGVNKILEEIIREEIEEPIAFTYLPGHPIAGVIDRNNGETQMSNKIKSTRCIGEGEVTTPLNSLKGLTSSDIKEMNDIVGKALDPFQGFRREEIAIINSKEDNIHEPRHFTFITRISGYGATLEEAWQDAKNPHSGDIFTEYERAIDHSLGMVYPKPVHIKAVISGGVLQDLTVEGLKLDEYEIEIVDHDNS